MQVLCFSTELPTNPLISFFSLYFNVFIFKILVFSLLISVLLIYYQHIFLAFIFVILYLIGTRSILKQMYQKKNLLKLMLIFLF